MTLWTALHEDNGIHVLPVDYIDQHDIEDCWCQPHINSKYGIITHRAFEDRTHVELWEMKGDFINPYGYNDNVPTED